MTTDAIRARARTIVRRLSREFPGAHTALEHRTPLQLLVATILSAQCTDERVNRVTKELFQKYVTAEDYANAPEGQLERDIQPTGFFRNKARSLRGCCQLVAEQHDGEVPRTMQQMLELPGVGRKTANVVLGSAYGLTTGVVVDTHVARLSRRMGLSKQSDPEKIERDLMQVIPKAGWIKFSHRMIFHGRAVCTARKPRCSKCCLNDVCPKIGVSKAQ